MPTKETRLCACLDNECYQNTLAPGFTCRRQAPTSKTVYIPEWKFCEEHVARNTGGSLERFVYWYDNGTDEWRERLRSVLLEARADWESEPCQCAKCLQSETSEKLVIIGWAVGELLGTPAMYNINEFDRASDAARRWGKPITGLVQAPNTPTFAPRPYSSEERSAPIDAPKLQTDIELLQASLNRVYSGDVRTVLKLLSESEISAAKAHEWIRDYVRDGKRGPLPELSAQETSVPRCEAQSPGTYTSKRCNLPRGHEGPHIATEGRVTDKWQSEKPPTPVEARCWTGVDPPLTPSDLGNAIAAQGEPVPLPHPPDCECRLCRPVNGSGE